jgi:alpha-N-arabinofuranosidase
MNRFILLPLTVVIAITICPSVWCNTTVSLTTDTDKVVNHIDEKVYGQFLEHIYHSLNGGLWGDMVWNRSFEDTVGGGAWSIKNGVLTQSEESPNIRLTFGDPAWRDYEYTLEARRTGGAEGFLVMFRVKSDDDFYWMNLGGYGNTRHALERGRTGEGRWGVIRDAGPGSIQYDRWYKIRIRCEGRRYQVWLDGEQILDFTDDDKAHLTGAVGISTWVTQAQFRNLKVTSLDGKTLFDGMPTIKRSVPVHYWRSYGPGQVTSSWSEPLNGSVCMEITGADGETGIEQTPFHIQKGVTYSGSAWVRGDAPGGLMVRLCHGAATLAEKSLPAPSPEWREYPFTLKARGSADDAALRIGVIGKGDLFIDQVSMMPSAARRNGGYRLDLLRAVADLKPTLIRWPGGCYAERYRWKSGIGPQHKRERFPITIWDDVDPNSFGTDEFIALCRKIGAEPSITVNSGRWDRSAPRSAYIQEACDWVEYCNGPATSKWGRIRAANGHPQPYHVKYWEIDNEAWPVGADEYISIFKDLAPALKKVDPSIKIIACGGAGFDNEWNKRIIDGCAPGFDYLSIHHYENPDLYAEGPRNYEHHLHEIADLIHSSANPNAKVFVSEWNAQSTDWRTGLYAAGMLNAFERSGDIVGIASPAVWLRHVSATDWDNAFINFNHTGWFPAPNYVMMKLWRDHYAPLRLSVEGETGPLSITASKSENGECIYIKAINPSPNPVDAEVKLSGRFEPSEAELLLVNPGSLQVRNTLTQPDVVHPVKSKVTLDGRTIRFTLPPLSAGVVTIR